MSKAKSTWKWTLLAGCVAVFVFEVVYAGGVLLSLREWNSRSAFGEMFGGLNTLFAGLALAGVIYTIFLQVQASSDARTDQAQSLSLLQRQIAVLREDLDLQRLRDRIERGPFFQLTSNSTSGSQLQLGIENVGAPVIIHDFVAISAGCSVTSWYPSTWSPDETLKATCQLAQNQKKCDFRLTIRDRSGEDRTFILHLDIGVSPARLDFSENEQLQIVAG